MIPSKRVMAVAVITLLILLGVYFVYNASFGNPEIPIYVGSFIHEYANSDYSAYYAFEYTIGMQDVTHHTTLYNCTLKVEYLTNNGEWTTITKALGTQNFSGFVEIDSLPMPDFKLDPDKSHSGNLWQTEVQNIRVKAYGYEKPCAELSRK